MDELPTQLKSEPDYTPFVLPVPGLAECGVAFTSRRISGRCV